jgi:hypothetical protein
LKLLFDTFGFFLELIVFVLVLSIKPRLTASTQAKQ